MDQSVNLLLKSDLLGNCFHGSTGDSFSEHDDNSCIHLFLFFDVFVWWQWCEFFFLMHTDDYHQAGQNFLEELVVLITSLILLLSLHKYLRFLKRTSSAVTIINHECLRFSKKNASLKHAGRVIIRYPEFSETKHWKKHWAGNILTQSVILYHCNKDQKRERWERK